MYMHSDLLAILIQQVHVFQFGHSTGQLNINSTSTCISIPTFDRLTAILFQTLYRYKVTCSFASLCIAMPCCCLFSPALMLFSWLTTSEQSFSSTLSVSLLRQEYRQHGPSP